MPQCSPYLMGTSFVTGNTTGTKLAAMPGNLNRLLRDPETRVPTLKASSKPWTRVFSSNHLGYRLQRETNVQHTLGAPLPSILPPGTRRRACSHPRQPFAFIDSASQTSPDLVAPMTDCLISGPVHQRLPPKTPTPTSAAMTSSMRHPLPSLNGAGSHGQPRRRRTTTMSSRIAQRCFLAILCRSEQAQIAPNPPTARSVSSTRTPSEVHRDGTRTISNSQRTSTMGQPRHKAAAAPQQLHPKLLAKRPKNLHEAQTTRQNGKRRNSHYAASAGRSRSGHD